LSTADASGQTTPSNDYSIILEDASLLAADKLSPIPVQPEKSGDLSLQAMLASRLALRDGRAPVFFEAVHRLDRRSSGIVLFAKTREAASGLSAQFAGSSEREGAESDARADVDDDGAAETGAPAAEGRADRRVRKTYWAVVEKAPEPPAGRLEHLLLWDPRRGKSYAYPVGPPGSSPGSNRPAPAGCKLAVLSYRLAGLSERYAMLEVEPLTGRTHQIRAQLSAAGMAIRGDLKYGAKRSTRNGLIMLHARALSFVHPVTAQAMELTAPPPGSDPLWAAFGP
jgi:23S rRNA pseudouridine1911/1915/1917 synthase